MVLFSAVDRAPGEIWSQVALILRDQTLCKHHRFPRRCDNPYQCNLCTFHGVPYNVYPLALTNRFVHNSTVFLMYEYCVVHGRPSSYGLVNTLMERPDLRSKVKHMDLTLCYVQDDERSRSFLDILPSFTNLRVLCLPPRGIIYPQILNYIKGSEVLRVVRIHSAEWERSVPEDWADEGIKAPLIKLEVEYTYKDYVYPFGDIWPQLSKLFLPNISQLNINQRCALRGGLLDALDHGTLHFTSVNVLTIDRIKYPGDLARFLQYFPNVSQLHYRHERRNDDFLSVLDNPAVLPLIKDIRGFSTTVVPFLRQRPGVEMARIIADSNNPFWGQAPTSLPGGTRLKKLHLESVIWGGPEALQTLWDVCPRLEYLWIDLCNEFGVSHFLVSNARVSSSTPVLTDLLNAL